MIASLDSNEITLYAQMYFMYLGLLLAEEGNVSSLIKDKEAGLPQTFFPQPKHRPIPISYCTPVWPQPPAPSPSPTVASKAAKPVMAW